MHTVMDIIGGLMSARGWALYVLFSIIVFYYNIKHTQRKPILKSLLLIYIVFVLLLTLFTRTQREHITAQWMPLWSWREVIVHHRQRLLEENVLNILMLAPIGSMAFLLNENIRPRHAFHIGLLFSMSIEFSQFIFHLGLFEWDDILHNTLGCVAGMFITKKLKR